jgi:hypothetical protein
MRTYFRCSALVIAGTTLFVTVSRASARRSPEDPTAAQTRPVSSSVLATILTKNQNVELLVLWRGSPGWFGGTHQEDNYSEGSGVFSAALEYGGVSVGLSYNSTDHEVNVQGRKIQLPRDSNVVLVDGIDQPGGPTSVETSSINGHFETGNPELADLFRTSPSAVAFLQCDIGMKTQVATRTMNRLVCDGLRR